MALSAGAGCGKTTVLTARFLQSLGGPETDRRPLRSLVALTFTEKAATRASRANPTTGATSGSAGAPGDEVAHWRSILRGLEAAPISTFHEFCGGCSAATPSSAGIDPDFQVLDEAIAASVRDESLARCVRRWLADTNADLIELAVEYGLPRGPRGARRPGRATASADLAAWAGRTEDEVVAVWRAVWKREGRANADPTRPQSRPARAPTGSTRTTWTTPSSSSSDPNCCPALRTSRPRPTPSG